MIKYAVVRNFMGEIEVEAEYDTYLEAQSHINKATIQESQMGLGFSSNFKIEEVTNER